MLNKEEALIEVHKLQNYLNESQKNELWNKFDAGKVGVSSYDCLFPVCMGHIRIPQPLGLNQMQV